MEAPGEDHEPHQENEPDEHRESSRSDEFALLLAKAIKVWERKVEITALAVSAATQTKILIDLQKQIRAAMEAERPIELLAAEWTEASEKKAALMTPLISAIWPDLFYIAYKSSKSVAEAKDTAQEASIQVMESIQNFEDEGNGFRPWYYDITVKTGLNHYRRSSRWFKLGQWWQNSKLITESTQELDDLSNARTKQFDNALAKLSEECRERFKHLKAAGTKLGGHDEIAKIMAEKLEASKKRTHVCVKQFRATYQALSEAQPN